jgi:hypothetical protein
MFLKYSYKVKNESIKLYKLRHFIPKHLNYNHEKDSSNAEHFKAYSGSFKKDPVIIYVHGNDQDRFLFNILL